MPFTNTTCATATEITSLPFVLTGVNLSGLPASTEQSDYLGPPTYCGNGSGASYNAIWYKYTLPPGQTSIKFVLTEAAFQLSCAILKGACGALDWSDCYSTYGSPSGNTRIFTGLTPGDTWYFMFTSYDNNAVINGTINISRVLPTGQFCIDVACAVAPPDVGGSVPIPAPPPSGCGGCGGDGGGGGSGNGGDGGGSGDNGGGKLPGDDPGDETTQETPCGSSGGQAFDNADSAAVPEIDSAAEAQFWMDAHYTNDEGVDVRLLWSIHHPVPDPPDYEGGRKRGKIRSIGQLGRSLSNTEGDYVGMGCAVEADDKDREVREILADPDRAYINGAEVKFKINTEERRQAREDGIILARGLLRGYDLGSKLSSHLEVEDFITAEYGPLGAQRLISDRKISQGLWSGCPTENIGKAQQIILGPVGDWGAYDPASGFERDKGFVPVTTVGARMIGGELWTEHTFAAHAVVGVDVYGSNEEMNERVRIPESVYGVLVLAPGHSGWPFATSYFDLVDAETGLTHRVSSVFTRGYISNAHLQGRINVALSVCGMDARGDSTGPMVTGLFEAWQLIADNWILKRPGYYSGLYTAAPTWEDGTPMSWRTSFVNAQTLSSRWIGDEGYQVGGVIQGGVLSKEVFKRFATTSNARYGWTRDARLFVSLPDDTMDVAGTPRLFTPFQIRTSTAPKYTHGGIRNPIFFNYDFDYDKNKWRGPQRFVRDDRAIMRTGRIERPAVVDCWLSRDPKTIRDARSRELLWWKYPRPAVQFDLPINGFQIELGRVVRINGVDGEGQGWIDAPVYLTAQGYDARRRRTTLDGVVMSNVLAPVLTFQTGDPVVFGTGAAGEVFRS